MPSNLQYSAAKTSKISRRLLGTSSSKDLGLNGMKGLGSRHATSVAKSIKQASDKQKKQQSSKQEQLVVSDYNVELDYKLPTGSDVSIAVSTILSNQWAESSKLYSRYFTQDQISSFEPHELVHMLRGISATVKNDILSYRKNNLPEGLVTVSQLYSIYTSRGNTYVDKNIELQMRRGVLRKFVITNASPVISQSLQRYQSGKITYGSENIEILTNASSYLRLISQAISQLKEKVVDESDRTLIRTQQLKVDSLTKFNTYIETFPASLFISQDHDFSKENFSVLLNYGFLTLTSNHLNQIESHQYAISYPNCGIFLKLIYAGRVWLVKMLSKNKYKEILEDVLYDRWEGLNPVSGESKMNNFRKPYYGYDLHWILADALGSGIVEVFNTPVGRGWKLTGKV